MLRSSLLGALLLPLLADASQQCRCRPSEPCWPASSEWDTLNSTVDGNLVAVRPVGAACHGSTFDSEACDAVTAVFRNSVWSSGQPGALQWQNWAARPSTEESCYIGSSRDIECGQGRISLFSVIAQTADHIQAAVKFAAKYDIRLAIKNSGHCFMGRSAAPESLQILTHNLKSINFVSDFTPVGGGKSVGSAATIGAGVQLKEMYTALGERNLTAVMGTSHTVGAAGGYIQGGGHSALGPWKGMASDNALEFNVVTASGEAVVANEYQNTDLFWALRGGGGGTFGVVTSVTIRTFTDPPGCLVSISLATGDVAGFWKTLESFHAHMPAINSEGGSGYYFMTPATNSTPISTMTADLIFANQTDQAGVDALFVPMMTEMADAVGSDAVNYTSYAAPGTKYFFDQFLPGDDDDTGSLTSLGSRLISRDFLATSDGPSRLIGAFKALGPNVHTLLGHIVAGGQVARNANIDSAVNPAWRRALTHIVVTNKMTVEQTWAEHKATSDHITNVEVPILKALEPDMGAYLNEADPHEVDFQRSFWGANYEKLSSIKKKWDPKALFIARLGVGSEEWDEDGLCRRA